MKAYGWIGFTLLLFVFLTIFTMSFQEVSIADSDNETSVENASRNAMTVAVNLGNARVNEEVTINEDIAVESVVRQYADSADFYNGDRYLNVYQVSSNPPMLAVESYTQLESPFLGITNPSGQNDVETRSREIIIYEAKKLIK
ncbi:DUF5411 family protein [Cytobacillus oceanisediminis]|uniref:DUF5411 family protein n=1 Tax=Cytobacillus oceanisediminis TaxID=665099 RepID=UPI00203D057B|nr:DUF5411 family protein [Cytobacillus oceanisediminis]MCM3405513.1 DUF5411 family protein [Cytobacillus oceanisediminis]